MGVLVSDREEKEWFLSTSEIRVSSYKVIFERAYALACSTNSEKTEGILEVYLIIDTWE